MSVTRGKSMHLFLYKIQPTERYDGPAFDEYCISEGKYLPANRDRTACITCPLSNLCQAGFEEQVRRLQRGENPSLTDGCAFTTDELSGERLLKGLTTEQIEFVRRNVPNL